MFQRKERVRSTHKRRWSPLMLISIGVTLAIVLVAGSILVVPRLITHAAAANPNCKLAVPENALSAQGLATPYKLLAVDPAQGACDEAAMGAFVSGAIIDPATGKVSIYNPLVINDGAQPAVAPTPPQLPANAIVGLWFGTNGDTLTLQDTNGSLRKARCVNGLKNSIFGQFAYCNAPNFFRAANRAIKAGQLVVPPLGTGGDGQPCPTVRDFTVVDADPSDNVTTTYLATADGKIAQMTAANAAALQNTTVLVNGSDNRLASVALDGALNCKPWTAPDLADNGNMIPSIALNELLAAAQQVAPIALIPVGDPMVLNNNQNSLNKLNLYRVGVNQQPVNNVNNASNTTFCQNLLKTAPPRFQLDMAITKNRPAPDPAVGNNLFTFLAARFNATYGADGLNCVGLLNMPSPVNVTVDGNGVAIDANVGGQAQQPPQGGGQQGGGGQQPAAQPVSCAVNGNVVADCNGTTQINGQDCTLALDQATNRVNITCPAANGGGQQPPQQGQQQPPQGGQQQPTPQPTPQNGQQQPTPQATPQQ